MKKMVMLFFLFLLFPVLIFSADRVFKVSEIVPNLKDYEGKQVTVKGVISVYFVDEESGEWYISIYEDKKPDSLAVQISGKLIPEEYLLYIKQYERSFTGTVKKNDKGYYLAAENISFGRLLIDFIRMEKKHQEIDMNLFAKNPASFHGQKIKFKANILEVIKNSKQFLNGRDCFAVKCKAACPNNINIYVDYETLDNIYSSSIAGSDKEVMIFADVANTDKGTALLTQGIIVLRKKQAQSSGSAPSATRELLMEKRKERLKRDLKR